MSPLISVIVPVYNVADYLPRCIDSLLAQNEQNFEILLINDGSKDSSGTICDYYASKDARIKVFHKANGGVSSARNLGLENANGKWLAFVDSDDEVTKDYLTIPQEAADCDILSKGFVVQDNNKNTKVLAESIITDVEKIRKYFVMHRNNALWDKIIAHRLITSERFNTNVRIGEDFLFCFSILHKVKKWRFCSKGMYIYYIRESSAMRSLPISKRMPDILSNMEHVKSISAEANIPFVGLSILVQSYIPFCWAYRRLLSQEQRIRMQNYISEINVSKLHYLDLRTKVKFCYIKLLNSLGL